MTYLAKLGHDVNKDITPTLLPGYARQKLGPVAKYMPRRPRHSGQPRSPTWGTFLRMHRAGTIVIDFLTVPAVTFNVPYMFFVVSLDQGRFLHINVTAHPYAEWAAQQIVEAVGFDTSIARMIRNRDRIYGARFDARVNNLGIQQLTIAPRAPRQNGRAERFVGTLRGELLDHVIVLGERQWLRLIQQHMRYDNEDRPHMALRGDAPLSRSVQRPGSGRVVAPSRVGGLHHRYARAA